MTAISTWRRVRTMTAAELRARTASALRIQRQRTLHLVHEPRWDRHALASRISPDIPALRELPGLLRGGNWGRAEGVLAEYFSTRASVWPVTARDRTSVAASIAARFPEAASDAAARADRIVAGRYDLLGHRDLAYGRLPDWHLDAAHGRRAPRRFWADVPYLDPAGGDHKVIWELNRHQHWTALGRACWLRDDGRYAEVFVDQLYSWLATNPPLTGINWASMLELAFRTISWTWAIELFAREPDAGGRPWRLDLLLGLDRQLAHIAANLSRYFSPNTHLTGEALALYVVSLAFPELRDSRARAALGRTILLQESQRQVMRDGVHIERSTHYHRYSTDFYLLATLVARRGSDPAVVRFEACARAQAAALRTLADEHGGLQTIGDDDGGQLFAMCGTAPSDVRTTLAIAAAGLDDPALAVSPPTEEACWVTGSVWTNTSRHRGPAASPTPWRSRFLRDAGYFVSRTPGALAIFDAGPHGFLNGGHAHADALALITTAGSRPLLIDPGTATYTMDAGVRDLFRSGRMHNTLAVDGEEHTAVGGPFQWRRRTDAGFLFTHIGDDWDVAQGVHDGYAQCRHVRTVFTIKDAGWLVVDQLLGGGRHRAESFWHIDPAWTLTEAPPAILLTHGDGTRWSLATTAGAVHVVRKGPHAAQSPAYGRLVPAPFVQTSHQTDAPFAIATFISPAAQRAEETEVAVHSCAAPDGWAAVAIVVTAAALHITALTVAPARCSLEWPAVRYGIPGFETAGRAAIFIRGGRRNRPRVAAGGTPAAPHAEPAPPGDAMAYAMHEVTG
jgi:hypothetical protein